MNKITTEAEWAAVSGEQADKSILHIVEIFASWCGPSIAVTSTLTKIANEYAGRKIKFCQMDSSVSSETQKYANLSKPHFLIFRDGDLLEVVEGINAPLIEKLVADHIPDGMADDREDEAEDEEHS